MTPNQRIFENIYKMSEMAQAKAAHIKDYIAQYPEVLDIYNDPAHLKPNTEANAKWKAAVNEFYDLYPEDLDIGNKTPGKSFSDSIFPISKRMKAQANAGKTEKIIAAEDVIKALEAAQKKAVECGFDELSGFDGITGYISSIRAFILEEKARLEDEAAAAEAGTQAVAPEAGAAE